MRGSERTDHRLSPDKKSFWVRAVVILLTTGTVYAVVTVTSRRFSQVDFTNVSDGDAGTAAQPAADGPPGAPTRAQVKQLHEALRQKLGTNARGLPRVTHMEYDSWPDRLHVVVSLDATAPTPAGKNPDLRPMRDVLLHICAAELRWSDVLVSGTAPAVGIDGAVSEGTVVRALFPRSALDAVDWPRQTDDGLPPLARQFAVDPGFAAPARPERAPAK